jgi:hypothetical protein
MTFVLRLRTPMHVVVWPCDDQRKSRSDVGTATVMLGHADSCHILGSLKCEKCHSIRCTRLVVRLISLTRLVPNHIHAHVYIYMYNMIYIYMYNIICI